MRIAALVSGCLALANCSSGNFSSRVDPRYGVASSERVIAPGEAVPKGGGVYRVGNPYVVAGRTYVPKEDVNYSATGLASWYGDDFHGRYTANGEIFDMNSISAAHPTLPLPSYVRVTNLRNHKSIVVRVNDRGPYARGRIIDLSHRAAELLDVIRTGTARVRVTYLGRADLQGGAPPPPETPPEIASALPAAPTAKVETSPLNALAGSKVAPSGRQYAMPKPAPSAPVQMAANEPTGQVSQVAVPAETHLYIQVGAFSKIENARTLLSRLGGGLRISALQRNGQTLYRVRTGPLNSVEDADAALSRITGAGSNDAHIVVDQ